MFILTLTISLMAAYFAKQEYDRGRIGWAMAWAGLLGWDLHSLMNTL